MKNGIGLKSVGSALNMSGKANVTEGNADLNIHKKKIAIIAPFALILSV